MNRLQRNQKNKTPHRRARIDDHIHLNLSDHQTSRKVPTPASWHNVLISLYLAENAEGNEDDAERREWGHHILGRAANHSGLLESMVNAWLEEWPGLDERRQLTYKRGTRSKVEERGSVQFMREDNNSANENKAMVPDWCLVCYCWSFTRLWPTMMQIASGAWYIDLHRAPRLRHMKSSARWRLLGQSVCFKGIITVM